MVQNVMQFDASLLQRWRAARRVVAFTGSGVSAESGVPTFRDAQTGLWARFTPEELATPEAFRRNPKLVWEWYAYRRTLCANAQPNAAHVALAALAQHFPTFTLITQNVDGLHQRAGSQNVLELHGNIASNRCFNDGELVASFSDEHVPPHCPRCGGLLRPAVVWFGEGLPVATFSSAVEAARSAEVFLAIGTSALVQPAASLPLLAHESGALVIEVNPSRTPLTPLVDFALMGPAGEVVPALLAALTAV